MGSKASAARLSRRPDRTIQHHERAPFDDADRHRAHRQPTRARRTAPRHWQHQGDDQRREREKAQQAENLRKMVLAMVDDVSVVLIKLADRLHNMRSAPLADPDKQRRKALETMEIYAPLANRLGIRQFKSELEDLAFKYIEPEQYREIEARLVAEGEERGRYVEQVTAELRRALEAAGIKADISGRWKHIYSIDGKRQSNE